MKSVMVLLILAIVAWQGYARYQSDRSADSAGAGVSPPDRRWALTADASHADRFTCDGRTYCSQMTSCAEATYFLRNCPGVKMDGNNDGVPCEKQWCR